MPLYLFVFAHVHHEFRLPELRSVAELHGFTFVTLAPEDPSTPFMVLGLDQEEHALNLARRCILVKSVFEHYANGVSYDELHAWNRQNQDLWKRYISDTSFKFLITAYNYKIPPSRQHEIVESFAYMGFLGEINMKSPQIILGCFEEYRDRVSKTRPGIDDCDREFKRVYFGRLLEDGSARSLVKKFDVKKRVYYGNTTMEAEMSLLMANQSLSSPGKLIYDPFMGTGSMAYTTVHFGAYMIGSDIDGRQMRGTGKVPGVYRAAKQYGSATRLVDLCTFDVTKHPWRCGGLFDAIVTDPPYGVRAGAKRLGRKRKKDEAQLAVYLEHRKIPRPNDQPYIPPTKPYEFSHLALDLVLFARYMLKPGGRLVFFLPTVNEDYQEIDIHSMICDGMELVANSLQNFGSWGRRLVTIRKSTDLQYSPPTFDRGTEIAHVGAHENFREKYFRGFTSESH